MMDTSKSLQELENYDWGEPDEASTGLVQKCVALRRVPLCQLSAENCRMLLGQQISPKFLVPLALEFLARDPLEDGGTMAPGAVLGHILRLPAQFWIDYPELWYQVNEIVAQLEQLSEAVESLAPDVKQFQTLQVG